MKKQNCWEYTNCGRQPGGPRVAEMGVCRASTYSDMDSINGGKNGGRSCWALAGTFCQSQAQGTFAMKIANCIRCDFYKKVVLEEGKGFTTTTELIRIIKGERRPDERGEEAVS